MSVKTFLASGPLDFATIGMRDFCGARGSHAAIFDEGEALRMAALSADFPMNLEDPAAYGYGQAPPAGYPMPAVEPVPQPAAAATAPGWGAAPGAGWGGAASPQPGWGQPQPPAYPPQPPAYPPQPAASPQPAQPGWSTDPFAAPTYPTDPGYGGQSGYGQQPPSYDVPAEPARPAAKRTTPAPTPATPNPFDLLAGGGTPAPVYPPSTSGSRPGGQPPGFGAAPDLLRPPVLPGQGEWNSPTPPGNGSGVGAAENGAAPMPWDAGYGGAPSAPSTRRDMLGAVDNPPSKPRKSSRGSKLSLPFSVPWQARRSSFVPTPDRDFARRMIERGPTIVVMGSRKGGVGKTSYAAGVAIVAGQVLDIAGHKAAIVDANIANPDAWGNLNLREGAATVREVIAALTGNREPPAPVHAQTPALACYPESRETTEYSKTDIRRLSDYLRRRFTFIVVDMSNRLPDPMSGPEAAAAAYWLEQADVLVLPTTSAKADFNGVLDYLDVRSLPPTVVPYIVPNVKKNREHAVTQEYLAAIRERVHRIVDIPDEADKVRYAGMEGVPVEQVSSSLRNAYRELTEAVVELPPRERTTG